MRGFIVPHSHWDREWHLTFQQFCFKLVKLVDRVLDILEQDPQFKYFTLDGQTVVLEDYLEIKPGERGRIEKLIRDGRLLIGPWYVLPDEFLVSGESIIRNLQKGLKLCSFFGGELRSGERAPLLVSCASSRLYQKQRNHELEILLEKYAEPFACWSWLQGDPYPGGFLRESWRLLLLNQPHDSICGCSNDQVHREIEIRFDQGEQIATMVKEESLNRLAGHIDTSGFSGEWGLLVFNPHPVPVDFPVEVELPDTGENGFSYLVDETGRTTPWQPLGGGSGEYFSLSGTPLQARMALGLLSGREVQGLYLNDFKISGPDQDGLLKVDLIMGHNPIGELDVEGFKKQALEILADKKIRRIRAVARQNGERGLFMARDLPGCGWRGYAPAPGRGASVPSGDLKVSRRGLENSFYQIKFNPDGTMDLLDKASGKELRHLHRLVDGGDRGDLYTFTAPEEDRPVDKPSRFPEGVKFEVTETGPVRATVRITRTYRIPASLAPDRRKRSRQKVNCRITTDVSLVTETPGVYFETVIDNRALDHRLRVHFPVPFQVQECWADGHFAVLSRSAQPPAGDYSDWAEKPGGLAPQKQFAAIDDGSFGIAVINRGLPEYEVLPGSKDGGAEIALTLLRAVGWLSRGDLANRPGHAGPAVETPGGQCTGEQTARYTLLPYRGNWYEGGVKKLAGIINAPPCGVIAGKTAGRLPACQSMLSLQPGNMELSCIKKADEGEAVIVRFFNCCAEEREAVIKPGFSYREVFQANLLEQPSGAPLQTSSSTFRLRLRPWQIATLRFEI
jgi:alpha-mannosidase